MSVNKKLNIYLNVVINLVASGGAVLVFLVFLLVFCVAQVFEKE